MSSSTLSAVTSSVSLDLESSGETEKENMPAPDKESVFSDKAPFLSRSYVRTALTSQCAQVDSRASLCYSVNGTFRVIGSEGENENRLFDFCVKVSEVNSPLIKAVAFCEQQNPDWNPQMEDASVLVNGYGQKSEACLIGVFSGFHGGCAAKIASEELPLLFLEQLSKRPSLKYSTTTEDMQKLSSFRPLFRNLDEPSISDDNPSDTIHIHRAFEEAFWRMDRVLSLGRNETSRIRWSGCTPLICLIESSGQEIKAVGEDVKVQAGQRGNIPGMIHIANAGNTHAVLCRNGKGYRLTKDHSTANPKERKRILRCGGSISFNEKHGLVEGLTKATRGLGHHGDPLLKRSVIPVPCSASIPIDCSFQFLILASSGLWEVLNETDVAKVGLESIKTYFKSKDSHLRNFKTLRQSPVINQDSEDFLSASQSNNRTKDIHNKIKEGMSESSLKTQSSVIEDSPENEYFKNLAGLICKNIVKSAMMAGSKENISVTVVILPGCDFIAEKL
ncbi:protein phosphatase 2C-like domain-containing protein 1 [Polypterus senegalus]